eukprot:5605354-Prymnesium_polylepis.1
MVGHAVIERSIFSTDILAAPLAEDRARRARVERRRGGRKPACASLKKRLPSYGARTDDPTWPYLNVNVCCTKTISL